MAISETLAKFICATDFHGLDSKVVEAAKRAILDTVGVGIGALNDPLSKVIVGYAMRPSQGGGRSTVIGQSERRSAEVAALANGSLFHLLDFDDTHNPMGGHPSAPVLAAALAVGEELESSGEDLLTAFIIGFEVETKLSRVTNPLLYDRGWHPTSVLSVFGATAAVCKLLRLDMGQATQAISSAASMCAGIKGNFATLTKSLHVGRAAQAAVQAGYLAKLGNTANVDIFETQMGFLDLYCSAKPTDWKLSAMEGTLGNPWEIITPGITVKPYPCGGSTHSTIDGHLALRKEHPIALSDIKEIKSGVHARRWPHTNRPAIRSGLEGKFSNQYVTALSWMFGAVELKHFTDEVALDPALQSLLTKIDFYKDPEISSTSEETHANVQVTLNDGTVLTKKVTRRKGSPSNPLTLQDLQQKFVGCTSLIRPTAWVSEALSKLSHLEKITTATELTNVLARER